MGGVTTVPAVGADAVVAGQRGGGAGGTGAPPVVPNGCGVANAAVGTSRSGAFGRGERSVMLICADTSSALARAPGSVPLPAVGAGTGVCERKRSVTERVIRSWTAPPRRKRTSDFAGWTLTS